MALLCTDPDVRLAGPLGLLAPLGRLRGLWTGLWGLPRVLWGERRELPAEALLPAVLWVELEGGALRRPLEEPGEAHGIPEVP